MSYKNRIWYIILLIFSVILVWIFQNRQTYTFLYFLLLLPLLSGGLSHIAARRVTISCSAPTEVPVKGETVNYFITLKSRDLFPYPFIRVSFDRQNMSSDTEPDQRDFMVMPFEERVIKTNFYCRYCGLQDIGVSGVHVSDYLRLFRFSCKGYEQQRITVYPRVMDIVNEPPVLNSIDRHSGFSAVEDDHSTILDYRQYRDSDSMKLVHWKLSAKTDELIVKKYGSHSITNTRVFLSQKRSDLPSAVNHEIRDGCIEGTVAAVNYLMKKGETVHFAYFTEEINLLPVVSMSDFEQFYGMCAELDFSSGIEQSDAVSAFAESNDGCTNLWIITSGIERKTIHSIEVIKQAGNIVSVFILHTENGDKDMETHLKSLDEMGIHIYRIVFHENAGISFCTYDNSNEEVTP